MNKEENILKLGKNHLNQWIKENPDKRFDLSNMFFENQDFSGWRFSKSLMNNSKFINCDFSNADLSEISALSVDFTGSKFIKAALYRANLSRSICINVDFLFIPKFGDIYNNGTNKNIAISSFSKKLCGKNRPGHFSAVGDIIDRLQAN